jgi:hypothetical protein
LGERTLARLTGLPCISKLKLTGCLTPLLHAHPGNVLLRDTAVAFVRGGTTFAQTSTPSGVAVTPPSTGQCHL